MARSKPSHEERVIAAMTTVAARYGYGGASVARVVAQAGVSRATFYEHFADKEDCFLAAYREVAGRVERNLDRIKSSRGVAGRPREIVRMSLEGADHYPAAARLLLIESLAGARTVRREHEQLLDRVVAWIDDYLGNPPDGSSSLEVPARVVLGGIGGVIAIRVFRGETGRLSELLDDLLGWLESHAIPSGHRRRSTADWAELGRGLPVHPESRIASPSRPLPRGRGALPPTLVANEQRDRILAAVAHIAKEKGYLSMSVADVVSAAAVTREAFYGQFRNKEDAFLAVQVIGLQESISDAAARYFSGSSWPDRVWNAASAVLEFTAGQPGLAHVELVESYAAGAASIRRSFDSRMAYTLFLEDGYLQCAEADRPPRLSSEAIAGALLELMRWQVVRGAGSQLMELAPQGVYAILAPFIGTVEAVEFVEARAAREKDSVGAA